MQAPYTEGVNLHPFPVGERSGKEYQATYHPSNSTDLRLMDEHVPHMKDCLCYKLFSVNNITYERIRLTLYMPTRMFTSIVSKTI